LKSKLRLDSLIDDSISIEDTKYQIADINFGKESIKELELLSKMMEHYDSIQSDKMRQKNADVMTQEVYDIKI
jgi:hypothetical protein